MLILKSNIKREIIFSTVLVTALGGLLIYIESIQAGLITSLFVSILMLWRLWELANDFHFGDTSLIIKNKIGGWTKEVTYPNIESITFRTNKRIPMLEVKMKEGYSFKYGTSNVFKQLNEVEDLLRKQKIIVVKDLVG